MVFDDDGTLTHRYMYGPGIDMILADEAFDGASGNFLDLYWMLGDHQGSVTSVLSHNSGQTSVVQQLAYTAFGSIGSIRDGQGNNVTTGSISRFAYTAREFDPETGDYYYRARYYDPQSGRFLSQDPIGFAAGDMNLYRYVGNSSPNFTDPSGMAKVKILTFIIGKRGTLKCIEKASKSIDEIIDDVIRGADVEVDKDTWKKIVKEHKGGSKGDVRVDPPSDGAEGMSIPTHGHLLDPDGNSIAGSGHIFIRNPGIIPIGTGEHWLGEGWGSEVLDFFNPLAEINDLSCIIVPYINPGDREDRGDPLPPRDWNRGEKPGDRTYRPPGAPGRVPER